MVALVVASSVSRAASGEGAAERIFAEAQAAARAGDFPAALRLLQRAHAADPKPKYIANQGIVYLEMGQYAEAAERFDWFIGRTDEPDDKALAQTFLRRLRPQVIIRTQPPGAEVRIDRELRGTTPLITSVLVGDHLLEVNLPGYRTEDRALQVALDEPRTVEIVLDAVEISPSPADPTPADVSLDAPQRRATPGDGSAWAATDWGWSFIGLGLISGAASATMASLSYGRIDDRDAAETREAWRDAQGDAESLATGYYVTGGLALVGVAAGIMFLISADDGGTLVLSPGGAGISVQF